MRKKEILHAFELIQKAKTNHTRLDCDIEQIRSDCLNAYGYLENLTRHKPREHLLIKLWSELTQIIKYSKDKHELILAYNKLADLSEKVREQIENLDLP